jgi:hypothetical protein
MLSSAFDDELILEALQYEGLAGRCWRGCRGIGSFPSDFVEAHARAWPIVHGAIHIHEAHTLAGRGRDDLLATPQRPQDRPLKCK